MGDVPLPHLITGGYENEPPRFLGKSRKFSRVSPVRMSDQTKDDFAALFDENFMQKMVTIATVWVEPVMMSIAHALQIKRR
jgi:hypothetical protein